MSYLHCPTCRCAYNLATHPACPACGIRPCADSGAQVSPVDAIVDAAEQLARAIGRANPIQLAKARAELAARGLVKALRAALPSQVPVHVPKAIEPVVPRSQQALLTTVVLAMLTRLPRRIAAARTFLRN